MTEMQQIVIQAIAENYGFSKQSDVCIEECSELIKAILKYRRGKGTVTDIIDELADVEIMIEQMKDLLCCHSDVRERISFKLSRQQARIKKGE